MRPKQRSDNPAPHDESVTIDDLRGKVERKGPARVL